MSAGPAPPNETGALLRSLAAFLAVGAVLWCVFYAAWAALPGLRAGHTQIYDLVMRTVSSGEVFPPESEVRVVIFGNSKVQAGFIPDLFDELADPALRLASYNLGIPNTTTFTDELETLVDRGASPTHVLLTKSWAREAPRDDDRFFDDEAVVDTLFPFRRFPRDGVLFVLRSLSRGGPLAFYRYSLAQVEQARLDRGYFFVEEMSHFPDDRLPESFGLDTDSSEELLVQDAIPEGPVFERAAALARRGGFEILFVPDYSRIGEYADAVPDAEEARRLAAVGIERLGPDYWLLPNATFSDPMHLNREGARCYTQLLWALVAPEVGAAPSPETTRWARAAQATRPICP